jgi:cyanophycinase-like exopeptidase
MMRLALVGGEEFADGFEDVHAELLNAVGGSRSRGVFLPTAAAEDGANVVDYWRDLARKRLSATGATVDAPCVVDKASANDERTAATIANADWIYLGGGKPHVAMGILNGTRVMKELVAAAKRGTLIIGASAGAMMMCTRSIVLTSEAMAQFERAMQSNTADGPMPSFPPLDCLNFIPESMCIPHFDRSYSRRWEDPQFHPAGLTLIGVDEQTAISNLTGTWQVSGRGTITIIPDGGTATKYHAGQQVII